MTEPRQLAAILAGLPAGGEKPASKAIRTRTKSGAEASLRAGVQGHLFKADATWVPVFRSPFGQGTMARLGPNCICVLLALKARADLRTGCVAAAVRTLGEDVGISTNTARDALQRLELEGLVKSYQSPGRQTVYELVERLPIVNADGVAVGTAAWPFHPREWQQRVNDALATAIRQLATPGATQTTINIGTINVLIVPGPALEPK